MEAKTLLPVVYFGFILLVFSEFRAGCQPLFFTTLAGNAGYGSSDGGAGKYAQFHGPTSVAVGQDGAIYVADSFNDTIRKISKTGVVNTIAGLAATSGGVDGPVSNATFNLPMGVAADASGNVFVADFGNSTIRMISPVGRVITIAGLSGVPGSTDGTNDSARFNGPASLAVDKAGNLYVADYWNNLIRSIVRVDTNWVVTTLAGSIGNYGSDDGTNSNGHFYWPHGIAADNGSNLFVADTFNSMVRKISPIGTNWVVTTLAGSARSVGRNDGTNGSARFFFPRGVAVDSLGNVFVADSDNSVIRKVSAVGTDWVVSTVAGNYSNGDHDGTNSNAQFNEPSGVGLDSAGNVLVADSDNNAIRLIAPCGTNWVVSTVAGLAPSGVGPDGTNIDARFSRPAGVAVDRLGNTYVADTFNCTIRRIDAAGVVTTLAGRSGAYAYADGTNGDARFNYPWGIALDDAGALYVADTDDSTIRKVAPVGTNWVVTTLAGLPYSVGGNDGSNGYARFSAPLALAVNASGEVFVADLGNDTIRKMTPSGTNWMVSTVAGLAGSSGSADGTNGNARFSSPSGITIGGAGELYVADTVNAIIRRITPDGTNWIVSTIAGLPGNTGNLDGTNSDARFYIPDGIVLGSSGELNVCDSGNNTIRKITLFGTNWVVSTVGGLPGISGNIDGAGTAARFNNPFGLAINAAGQLCIADMLNGTIRQGWTAPPLSGTPFSNQFIVEWPMAATGYVLEESAAVSSPANWKPLTNDIAIDRNSFVLTNKMDVEAAFYRLHRN
ncbi:MAG TPA: hypothetical protein VFE51_03935 [Verrucomicrobiae bacterium]|nr:hypothetical protein [Verrucomicrobiae bacterium]